MWIGDSAAKFVFQNLEHELVSEHGVLLRFVSGKRSDHWIEMDIVIDPDTTIQEIRDSWGFILEWRERLENYQGPWTGGGDNQFYLHLLWSHDEAGASYQELADRINDNIANLLMEFTKYQQELEEAYPDFETMIDFVLWRSEHNRFSLDHARDLMRLSGVDEEEIDNWIDDALKNIANGDPAFLPGVPVTRAMVRSRIRYQGKQLHQRLKEQENSDQGGNKTKP